MALGKRSNRPNAASKRHVSAFIRRYVVNGHCDIDGLTEYLSEAFGAWIARHEDPNDMQCQLADTWSALLYELKTALEIKGIIVND